MYFKFYGIVLICIQFFYYLDFFKFIITENYRYFLKSGTLLKVGGTAPPKPGHVVTLVGWTVGGYTTSKMYYKSST